jgi:uridine kinase
MARGIIIFGSSGSGTTTLGREVAKRLGFKHFDIDDYIWNWDTEVPFTVMYSREEKKKRLMDAIIPYSHFVMSGSMDSINASFVPLFDLAVHLTAPVEVRVERVNVRELARFGKRILPGGDMFEIHNNFIDNVRRYDTDGSPCLNVHKQWAATLPCPVLHIDGTVAIEENTSQIAEKYIQTK